MQTRTGIIDLGAFCVELWPKQVSYRISVPMSYISCSRLIISMFHKSQKTRGPDGLRPQGHRKSRADLKNNNFAPKNKWVTIWGGGPGGGPEHFLDRHGTLVSEKKVKIIKSYFSSKINSKNMVFDRFLDHF